MTRPRSSILHRVVSTFFALLLGVGILLAAPPTAMAAPGDASAVGFLADFEVDVVGGTGTVTIDDRIGEVTAPPSDSASLADAATAITADLGPLGVQTVAQATLIETSATSNAAGSAATAQVTRAQINTALGLLTIDAVGSEVNCPTVGTPTADVTPPATVTLNGTTVVLDVDGETVIGPIDPGPGAVTLTLTVDQTTTTSDTAAATAFVFGLEQNFTGIVTATGTLTLAQAECEAPLGPTATALDPDSGPTTGGTEVTVTGTGFVPGETTVTIGGNTIPADEVDVDDDGTSLTFLTPPHVPGTVDVTVTTPGGTTEPLDFTYFAVPTATALDPDSGPTTGDTEVTVTGTGFVPGETTVTIGGNTIPADEVDVDDDGTSLTFLTPPHVPGTVDVTVTTPGGTTEPLDFTYFAVPTATALDPDSGPTTGDTEVTVTGTGFVPGETTVTIGGNTIPADEVDVDDDGTSLTFETPAHAAGAVDVTVTTPGGTTEPLEFTFIAAAVDDDDDDGDDDGEGGGGEGDGDGAVPVSPAPVDPDCGSVGSRCC